MREISCRTMTMWYMDVMMAAGWAHQLVMCTHSLQPLYVALHFLWWEIGGQVSELLLLTLSRFSIPPCKWDLCMKLWFVLTCNECLLPFWRSWPYSFSVIKTLKDGVGGVGLVSSPPASTENGENKVYDHQCVLVAVQHLHALLINWESSHTTFSGELICIYTA